MERNATTRIEKITKDKKLLSLHVVSWIDSSIWLSAHGICPKELDLKGLGNPEKLSSSPVKEGLKLLAYSKWHGDEASRDRDKKVVLVGTANLPSPVQYHLKGGPRLKSPLDEKAQKLLP